MSFTIFYTRIFQIYSSTIINNYLKQFTTKKQNSKTILNLKQVDILIFKNQALQILYLKHCVYKLPWIRNLQNPQKFDLK